MKNSYKVAGLNQITHSWESQEGRVGNMDRLAHPGGSREAGMVSAPNPRVCQYESQADRLPSLRPSALGCDMATYSPILHPASPAWSIPLPGSHRQLRWQTCMVEYSGDAPNSLMSSASSHGPICAVSSQRACSREQCLPMTRQPFARHSSKSAVALSPEATGPRNAHKALPCV